MTIAPRPSNKNKNSHRTKRRRVGASNSNFVNAEAVSADMVCPSFSARAMPWSLCSVFHIQELTTCKAIDCAVCKKLFEVLTVSSADSSVRTELGSVPDLVQNSQCFVHPRALLVIFGDRLHAADEYDFIAIEKVSGSLCAGITLNPPGKFIPGRCGLWSREIYLAGSEEIARKINCKTHVDPAWIDRRLMKKWKTACDDRHHAHTEQASQTCRIASVPNYLIDTINECLIEVNTQVSYVALSYVWGRDMFFRATKQNLPQLLQPHAFGTGPDRPDLPQTIRDACEVVKSVGESFLWVDALCIPDDDDEIKHKEIRNMAAIYANASFTIVAAQGVDARAGLRGLEGSSQPRSFRSNVAPFLSGSSMIRYYPPDANPVHSMWARRGWTFQECLLSRRLLVFNQDTVYWQCPAAMWTEVNDHGLDRTSDSYNELSIWDRLMRAEVSEMLLFGLLIREYNTRTLTYPEDALDAFTGLMSELTATKFRDGFFGGLPVVFFDVFLLWEPRRSVERRQAKNTARAQAQLPSWSWLGWHGELDMITHGRPDTNRPWEYPAQEIITPICEWCAHETPISIGIPLPESWHKHRMKTFFEDECPSPDRTLKEISSEPGWTHTYHQKPNVEPRHALPNVQASGKSKELNSARFLSCRARRIFLYLGEAGVHLFDEASFWFRCLRDVNGRWAGVIKMHLSSDYEGFDMDTKAERGENRILWPHLEEGIRAMDRSTDAIAPRKNTNGLNQGTGDFSAENGTLFTRRHDCAQKVSYRQLEARCFVDDQHGIGTANR